MRRALFTIASALVIGGLAILVLDTASGPGDWIELGVILVGVVLLWAAVESGMTPETPKKRGFTRTPDSDW